MICNFYLTRNWLFKDKNTLFAKKLCGRMEQFYETIKAPSIGDFLKKLDTSGLSGLVSTETSFYQLGRYDGQTNAP